MGSTTSDLECNQRGMLQHVLVLSSAESSDVIFSFDCNYPSDQQSEIKAQEYPVLLVLASTVSVQFPLRATSAKPSLSCANMKSMNN